MPRTSDKKERLLESAKDLIHKQGFNQTSLADIARDSGVPLGNVYYYFRTKEEIGSAVILEHEANLKALLHGFEQNELDPRQRILLYLNFIIEVKEITAASGCPIASLCQELDKDRSTLSEKIDAILKFELQWVTEQFEQMGQSQSIAHGQHVIVTICGTGLLANALNDPEVVINEIARLKAWVEAM